ncbi:methionine ABC transporter permease [Liquorilactobacillus hordei]|uniref:methionine ABC transporter permease n=1 Tax=Liquorilactobacillus hordei TaxID=468911 RepID=UPI001CBD56C0|nr:methionine ABC transporter permease [Liquorilactobacillus hordei]MBZ2406166.1 methionine ABC transporter permease [Liquorilactobacillus hordei]
MGIISSFFPNVVSIQSEFIQSTIETIYMVFVAGVFSFIIGMFLGIALLVTKNEQLLYNRIIYYILDKVVNLMRSIPFIILMALLVSFTRVIVHTTIGTNAAIVPIVVAIIPFYARQVENVLLDVDSNLVETAQSMGWSIPKIIWSIYLREARKGLIRITALTTISIVSLSAMAGVVGGGGLGNLAINYGYNRFQNDVTFLATLVILLIVLITQFLSTLITRFLKY